jgi:hypothetical protein
MAKRKTAPGKKTKAAKPAKPVRSAAPKPDEEANGNGVEVELGTADLKKIFDEAAKVEEGRPALKWVDVECPHCNEEFEVRVDPGEGGGDMVEECHSCSKPVSLSVEVDDDGEVTVSAYQT